MLGPRLGRYDAGIAPLPLGNPVNAVMGLFVLWWGWLAFNSGSTYGLSGEKWHYAARAAVMTMMSTFGGGTASIFYTMIKMKGKIDAIDIINGILGSLVSITAGCFLYKGWEAALIGTIGSLLVCGSMPLFDLAGVDDPVGASAVHGVGGIWGIIAVGIFAENPYPLGTTNGRSGLIKGGGWYLFGVQCLTALCLLSWGIISTVILLWIINKFITIRMDVHVELLGADLTEHLVKHGQVNVVGVSRALSAFRPVLDTTDVEQLNNVGLNPGHDKHLEMVKTMAKKKRYTLSKILRQVTKNKNLGINVAKNLFPKNKTHPRRLSKRSTENFKMKVTNLCNETDYGITPHVAWLE
nr:putative ammonium transporter 3 isoform X1 [Leptinotarsa decemlineata]XP_023030428.1 putative ammonium transporter 3 isoform X1 [Leptinotarsa decemlineata]